MYLFCNSNFDESYPEGPVTLPMGSALHVGVSVAEIDPSFVAVLEDCYTTPSSNPDDPIRYLLIHSRYTSHLNQMDFKVKSMLMCNGQ